MGQRLSKIYTRTGDDGSTGLGDGSRLPKDDARIETFGAVDELNSVLGVVLTHHLDDRIRAVLTRVQHELFDLGGELAVPGYTRIEARHIDALERELDDWNQTLPPLKEFILPGGGPAAAHCHLARAVCRRAERRLIGLAREARATDRPVNPQAGRYLNRLSDLLFVLARIVNRTQGEGETFWQSGKGRSPTPNPTPNPLP